MSDLVIKEAGGQMLGGALASKDAKPADTAPQNDRLAAFLSLMDAEMAELKTQGDTAQAAAPEAEAD